MKKVAAYAATFSLSINPGGDKGDAAPYVQSGADDMCVRTDENPGVFVLCGFRRPGAMREAKSVKTQKVAFSHFFDSLRVAAYAAALFTLRRKCVIELLKNEYPRLKRRK